MTVQEILGSQPDRSQPIRVDVAPGPNASATRKLRAAKQLLLGGRPDRALYELNDILQRRPRPSKTELALAHLLRARAYDRQGRGQLARLDCEHVAKYSSDQRLLANANELMLRHGGPSSHDHPRSEVRPVDSAVLPRDAWGAAPANANRLDKMGRIFRLTVHHSANLIRNQSESEAARAIRLDQKFHMGQRRWGDIGYHFLIDPAGRVWSGRSLQWQGAHAGNSEVNRGNIGVCLLGSFVAGPDGQAPGRPQIAAMARLVKELCGRYRIPVGKIFTHQEITPSATACPGERLQQQVDVLRRDMAGQALLQPTAATNTSTHFRAAN